MENQFLLNQNERDTKENNVTTAFCRICLIESDTTVSLLTSKDDKILLDMFSSVTSIRVNSKDRLSLQICKLCESEVVHFYQFKTKCIKSHHILKSLVKKGLTNKNDSILSLDIKGAFKDNDINAKKSYYKSEIVEKVSKESNLKSEIKTENSEIGSEEETEVEYLDEEIFDSLKADEINQISVQDSAKNTEKNNLLEHVKSDPGKESHKGDLGWKNRKGKKKRYKCSYCSKEFLRIKTLKMHIKQMHGKADEQYGCTQCKESFSCDLDLQIHSVVHTKGPTWTCSQCNKEFKERGKLRRHVRRHMQSKQYACEWCGKQFVERSALQRHTRVHTGEPPDKKYACHICDNRYSDKSALAAHEARHAGLRPCACVTCGKAFPSPRLLASHRRVHSDRKPFACTHCDKRFRHESTRNTHLRTHTGDRPYVCSACGKRFIQNSNLTLHMRTHTGEKPYKCDVCERQFSSGSALANHRRTHTGEKPYCCPVCGKWFARFYLSAHMRQHTGERPFACCVCPKRFANAARLRQHNLIHTGEKPFECAICSEKFKSKAYLAKHIKNHELIKKLEKGKVLLLQQVDEVQPIMVGRRGEVININQTTNTPNTEEIKDECVKDDITVEVMNEMPMEVTGELILPDNEDVKTQLVVIDQGEGRGNICLQTDGLNLENNDVSYTNDMNLVTVNEGEVNISSSAVLEGTTVKLYQLDQSLVQIHTSGGQVTISKITSKMTANF